MFVFVAYEAVWLEIGSARNQRLVMSVGCGVDRLTEDCGFEPCARVTLSAWSKKSSRWARRGIGRLMSLDRISDRGWALCARQRTLLACLTGCMEQAARHRRRVGLGFSEICRLTTDGRYCRDKFRPCFNAVEKMAVAQAAPFLLEMPGVTREKMFALILCNVLLRGGRHGTSCRNCGRLLT